MLQTTYHGPLGYELVAPLPPIFTRTRAPTTAELESGSSGPQRERSFYRNTYAMVCVFSYMRSQLPLIVHTLVHGPYVLSRVVLLPRHQAQHDASVIALPGARCTAEHCTRAACACGFTSHASSRHLAGEHRRRGPVHGRHGLNPFSHMLTSLHLLVYDLPIPYSVHLGTYHHTLRASH